MNELFLTSDFHFCHQQPFCYEPRGFSSAEEMNEKIIENFNSIVQETDDVYFLGDLMLNDTEAGLAAAARLKGRWHIVLGNHDTLTRAERYKELPNVVDICYANVIKYGKFHFYLSHYPTLTGNDKEGLWRNILNLYGHTHQGTPFSPYSPYMYNVGVDAHNCMPVHLDQVLADMKFNYDALKEYEQNYPIEK